MIGKILVALDGSTQAGKALDLAIDMARAFTAKLMVLHTLHLVEHPHFIGDVGNFLIGKMMVPCHVRFFRRPTRLLFCPRS